MSKKHKIAIWGMTIGMSIVIGGTGLLLGVMAAFLWKGEWAGGFTQWCIAGALVVVCGAGTYKGAREADRRWRRTPDPLPDYYGKEQ